MTNLEKLQNWYLSNCNDGWEHSYGVKVDTLDNPGWSLMIDLAETSLSIRKFEEYSENYDSNMDWLTCRVEDEVFKGACGPLMLEKMIGIFLDWTNGNSRFDEEAP